MYLAAITGIDQEMFEAARVDGAGRFQLIKNITIPSLLPTYFEVFKLNGLSAAAIISVARTVIGTACTVMASAFLGFMFSQQKMSHRKLWYRLVVMTMYFNASKI